jgi:hypothetical protein
MFFTYILDKKLIIEADDAGSFSVAILTATIETLVYTGLLAFNNAWLGSLSTPIMKIVFALEGILFVNYSFAVISMGTNTKKFSIRLLKYALFVIAILIPLFKFESVDISFNKGIVIASDFLFEEPARAYFPWDWVFL